MAPKTRTLDVQVAQVFRPLLDPSRYKAAYGGRGSGKSHFFAEHLVTEQIMRPGLRSVGLREVQNTIRDSSKRLIANKIQELGVGHLFEVQEALIKAPGGGEITFRGMRDQNAESIKSLEGIGIAWFEEAQTASERSLAILRPTIRAPGSEMWFSWNPRRKTDAVDRFFRVNPPIDATVVRANWSDNPWFPDELNKERLHDQRAYPDRYEHIWEGGYQRAFEGAYYADLLAQAERDQRIGKLAADPILPVWAFWDIGGAGRNADLNVIWIVQFAGRAVCVLDCIETRGQVLGYVLALMRERGWAKAICITPHDGVNANNVTGMRLVDHIREAGFDAPEPSRNAGPGAKLQRIEATRRILPSCWFDEERTEGGREALAFYHERKDESRDVGLGPEHDWSSHAADAFGYMAVYREEALRATDYSDEYYEERDQNWTSRNSTTGY